MTQELYQPQRNWGARIREYAYHGLRMIVLENEVLRVGILAGKGTDIVELNYKPIDLDFVWLAPGGVRNPLAYASSSTDPGALFRESYPGGWQEIFPNGGAPSTFAGAQFGQHGDVFSQPWDVAIVEESEAAVAVRFTVKTLKIPCQIEKTVRLDRGNAEVRFDERVINLSPVGLRAMWGHHITFGPPFLAPGCRIRLPHGITVIPHHGNVAPGGRRLSGTDIFPWPRDPGNGVDLGTIPDHGSLSDVVYLAGFSGDDAWYEVGHPGRGIGSRVEWDANVMPFLWYWQEFGASTGYPWYGRNFNIGLEPFTSFPSGGLAESVENDSALHLGPGEERQFWLKFSVLNDDAVHAET